MVNSFVSLNERDLLISNIMEQFDSFDVVKVVLADRERDVLVDVYLNKQEAECLVVGAEEYIRRSISDATKDMRNYGVYYMKGVLWDR